MDLIELFQGPETQAQLETALPRVRELLKLKVALQAGYRVAEAALDEAKAMVQLSGSIDGKNAEIGAAQVLVALKDSPMPAQIDKFRVDMDQLDAELEIERMRWKAGTARLAYVTAALGVLGS